MCSIISVHASKLKALQELIPGLYSTIIAFEQFTRPARDTYIRIFGEEGDEVVTINTRTSSAVTYPNNVSGHTLIFYVHICQFPVNHTFYILLDTGKS